MAIEAPFEFDEIVEKLARIPRPVRLGAVAAIVFGMIAGYYFLVYQVKAERLANRPCG